MIRRTYGCSECNHMMTIELRSDQWDMEPPECPMCASDTHQEFVAPGIVGSVRSKATALALDIAEKDYGVADIQADGKPEGRPKVRFKDASPGSGSTWGVQTEALSQAIAAGRESRLKYGSGLDVLQTSLKNGSQPDLIEASKRRSMRVW